jgi:LysR family nitrogen assimilation transcriptional regulator
MDLQQLEYFVRVADQRSFSNAAVLLDVSQPTLSRSVRALEVELKTTLFRRNGRGVQPTPAGRRFLDHARRVLRGAEAAREAVREGRSRQAGRIAIGLPQSLAQVVIPQFTETFLKRFPQASLSIVQGLSDGLSDQVAAGRLDFAVIRNPAPSSLLTIELIGNEELFLLGSRRFSRGGKPVRLEDLQRVPLIMPNAPNVTRPLIEAALARRGLALHVNLEVDSVPSLIELVAKGLGYSIIPATTCLVVPPGRGLHAEHIDAPELRLALCLVSPARPSQTVLVAEAARHIRELVAKALAPRGVVNPPKRAKRARAGSA